MVGRVDALEVQGAVDHWKARGIDLSEVLTRVQEPPEFLGNYAIHKQDHGLEKALDLPHAATLCNQCGVVCPVKIPLPELMRKLREKPQAVIILTDGDIYGGWGSFDVPVLWCIVNNKRARPPYGKVVHIEV
jgi:hypothetical protein